MDVDRYKINNTSLIGRILPFFARGRRLQSFLIGITTPLTGLHGSFLSWALMRKAECVATSQPIMLLWYLKKVFENLIENNQSQFSLEYNSDASYLYICEDDDELSGHLPDDNLYSFEDSTDETDILGRGISGVDSNCLIFTKDRFEMDFESVGAMLCVYAPKQMSGISDDNYKRMIRQCLDRLLVYNMEYEILIQN